MPAFINLRTIFFSFLEKEKYKFLFVQDNIYSSLSVFMFQSTVFNTIELTLKLNATVKLLDAAKNEIYDHVCSLFLYLY